MSTCTSCPSYMTDQSAIMARFDKKPGGDVPMCATYGQVLGRPGQTADGLAAVAVFYGEACPSYGETPVTIFTGHANAQFAQPDPASGVPNPNYESLPNCNACKFMVKPPVMRRETGYSVAGCSMHGTLILNASKAADACMVSERGPARDDIDGVSILPQFAVDYRLSGDDAVRAFAGHTAKDEGDPTDHPTDKEVTSADEAQGIKAWRLVQDPNGFGPDLYAPIFRREALNPALAPLVPKPGDESHPELFIDYAGLLYPFVAESIMQGETVALLSKPGIGKTTFAEYVAMLCGLPFIRIPFTEHTEPDDVLGYPGIESGDTVFNDGPLSRAWISQCITLLDEPNTAQDSLWQTLRSAFDAAKTLTVNGYRIQKNTWCLPVLAMNPAFDVRNLGTKELADADTNRLSPLWVPPPPEAIEREIITKRCLLDGYEIPEARLNTIFKISADIREAEEQGTFPASWGTRQTIKVARKTRFYPMATAFSMAALDFYDPQTKELVEGFIASHTE